MNARVATLSVVLVLSGVAGASASAAVPFKSIVSPGPLPTIAVGDEGSCQVAHTGDQRLELFPSAVTPGDCGTFIAAGDILYGPNLAAHDGSAAAGSVGPLTPFTPESQSEVTGAGTPADPFRIVTVFGVGSTGLRVTQTDSYAPGQESFRTDIVIQNTGATAQAGTLYRAGDCYLQESDVGFGFVEPSNNGPGCSANANNVPAGRIEQWVPLTAGASYLEDRYASVWNALASRQPLANSCQCTVSLDNAAAISWSFTVPPGGRATYSHLTVFSPTGVTGGQLPAATPAPAPAALPAGVQVLPLPPSRVCTSRRAFPIRVRQYPGVEYSLAIVAVNGRRVPVYVYGQRRLRVTQIGPAYLNTRRFRAFVDLRGLVRGTYKVRVTVVTTDGGIRMNTRRYHTCGTRPLRGSIPKL